MSKRNIIIMGAAGRDFHNFNVFFRDNPNYCVKAFTACQIPNIEGRLYPPQLCGNLYPDGIKIFAEEELADLIKRFDVHDVVFAYSDVSHEYVMHKASLVNACGANFVLMGANETMLKSTKPVIAVCAIRTGCGKSQTSRRITQLLKEHGKKVAVIRHPMPYGDLNAQRCQRFETLEDLDKHKCTIEEREEYEAHIEIGNIVYAGVDYQDILNQAQKEADVILWDGGNNDTPFFKPDLHITLVDPHRPGHEKTYYPGETNLRMADVVIVSKIGTASQDAILKVKQSIKELNPKAKVIDADSVVRVSDPNAIKGKKVLVIEDGPTLTHGEMTYGAGIVAAKQNGASQIIDPRPYAKGSIQDTYKKYTHIQNLLPAMGYGEQQIRDLKATIEDVPCDVVLVGTPFDLRRLIKDSRHSFVRVSYELDDKSTDALRTILSELLKK